MVIGNGEFVIGNYDEGKYKDEKTVNHIAGCSGTAGDTYRTYQCTDRSHGVLPIVNPVGGLKDTVINIDSSSEFGTGLYMKSYNFESIVNCLDKAIDLYNSKQWLEIQNRLIKINFSWNKQIKEYINFIA